MTKREPCRATQATEALRLLTRDVAASLPSAASTGGRRWRTQSDMRITIHCDAKGRERAAYGETEADSLTALARALVSAGMPDQSWTAGWPRGVA